MGVLLFGLVIFPAQAVFTSLYIFGDGLSTTTNGPGGSLYYGKRYTNGRVWAEVLADRQGLICESNKNWSYFGHYSRFLVTNVNNFTAPTNAETALFVVWVNNADFVDNMGIGHYTSNYLTAWTDAVNKSLTNHWKAITNLFYAKGVRTLIMPNAVDITWIPQYSGLAPAEKNFVRQRVVDFNIAFKAILNQARVTLPGLTIHEPDVFTLLDDVVANSDSYGLTNALFNGHTIGAVCPDPTLRDFSLNGPGARYIFWDWWHPTAKLHAHVADYIQQSIWPVRVNNIIPLDNSNRLEMVNIPVGRDGCVECTTNFADWLPAEDFDSTNSTQSICVPASGPEQFYRLRFPFSWTWP